MLLFYVLRVNLNVIAGYALTKCYGVCHKQGWTQKQAGFNIMSILPV